MINTCKNDTKQHYIPNAKLTYHTRLKQMLKEELGYQGKPKVLDLLASEIEEITNECYSEAGKIGIGQVKVILPSVEDKPSWGQTIEDTKLVTVTLSLFSEEDRKGYLENEKSGIIQQRRLSRIAKEAIAQGGVLTSSVAGELLGLKQTTISKYTKEYYERTAEIIPLRGFIHDIGRTTTHKRWIIELYLNGYTTKEIQEKTKHKISSIDRYLKRYMSILSIVEELKTLEYLKISRILGISESSVKENLAIYLEYKEASKIKRIDYYKEINGKTDIVLKELAIKNRKVINYEKKKITQ